MSIALPFLVGLPFLGALLAAIINKRHSHTVSMIFSAIAFIISLYTIYIANFSSLTSLAFTVSYIPQLNLSLNFSMNSLTLMLALMTAIVFLAAAFVQAYFIKERGRIYSVLFLLAEGASFGVFLSANLLLLYLFWEITEIMMFFIIFLYGGYNRRYASIKFLVYSLLSSLLLLIAIIILYNSVTPHTFNIGNLVGSTAALPVGIQLLVTVLLLFSFMIKLPVFPLHSWLPDAHTEAPTTGSMILAGVLLKFGGYGIFLLLLIVPFAMQYASTIAIVFAFSSVYAALVALRQTNIKRMIAYVSVTDMGIVALGLFAANASATNGAFYAMLSHGIAISILFLVAGTLDELYGTLEIDRIKGVIKNFRGLTYIFILGAFVVLGLPLTTGFIADIALFFGAFSAFGYIAVIPLFGIIVIGAMLFWVIERMFMNPSDTTEPYTVTGYSVSLSGTFLLIMSIVFGIAPFILLGSTFLF